MFLLLVGIAAAHAKVVAYIANSESDTVSIIVTTTNSIEATVAVGAGLRPRGVALAPDDRRLYVTNPTTNSVSAVDLQTNEITTLALPNCPALGCNPEAVVASRDGRFIYVLNHPYDAVWVEIIDATNWAVVGHTAARTCDTVGGTATIAITPDGSTVYATGPCGLSVIDTASSVEILQLPGDYFDVAVTPDGSRAILAGFRQVAVVDTSTNRIAATLVVNPLPSQASPELVAVSPNGRVAYVVAGTALLLIDVATATLQATVDLGEGNYPWQIAVVADAARVVLATPNRLLSFDTAANAVTASIALARVPEAITVSADGQYAYLTNRRDAAVDDAAAGTVTVVELGTGEMRHLFPEAVPVAVAAAPDGTAAYVANAGTNELAIIDPSRAAVRGTLPIHHPSAIVIDGRRSLAYVSAHASADPYSEGVIEVIDLTASTRIATIAVGPAPGTLALSPNGEDLYAAIPGGIAVIDTTTYASRTVAVGSSPAVADLAVGRDGLVYHASTTFLGPHNRAGEVRVIDIDRNSIVAMIGSGGFGGIAIAPDGKAAYATGRDGVAVINTTTHTIARTILAFGRRLAITPDGRFLYLLNDAVSVVDTRTNVVVARIGVGVSPAAIAVTNHDATVSDGTHGDGCSVDPKAPARPGVLLMPFLVWMLRRKLA